MAVKDTYTIAVGTSPTALNDPAVTANVRDTDGSYGSRITFYNDGAVTFYVGGPDVTASGSGKGVPVPAGGQYYDDKLNSTDIYYGIVASGTCNVIAVPAGV